MIGFLLFTACSDYELNSISTANDGKDSSLFMETDGLTEEESEDVPTEEFSSTVEFAELFTEAVELEVNDVDIAFVLDTTSSMSQEAQSLANEFSSIVDELSNGIPNAAYGFATFDDYNGFEMGSGADHPFFLHNQITTNLESVQSSLNSITIHSGHDPTESGMEALYQALTGLGYDQNGDGIYDPNTDILPFIAKSEDAFGGTVDGAYDSGVAGSGTLGGFGFREGALPVIVYATDATMRDRDADHPVPPSANHTAGNTDVVHASDDLGARLIGVATQSSMPRIQMKDLAVRTGSVYDQNGDGNNNTPLVFNWSYSSEAFRNTIVGAVEGLLASVTFDTVSAQVKGNDYGFNVVIDPPMYEDVLVGTDGAELEFNVVIHGEVDALPQEQVFPMTLEIYGDDSTLLGSKDVTIRIPAVSNAN